MKRQSRRYLSALVTVTGLFTVSLVQAQSSVTIYGVVDGGLLYTSKTSNPQTGINSGRQVSIIDGGSSYSHFGLIGTEDLGGGVTAKFKLESAFSIANGGLAHCNGNLFGCEAWVSIASDLGEAKMGLQFSPFFLAVYETDPRGLSFFGSGGVNFADNLFGTSIYSPSAISYSTPKLWGVTSKLMYTFGGQAGNSRAGRQFSASVKYEYNGLLVNAAVFDGNAGGANQTAVPSNLAAEARTLGVAYAIGTVTATASFVNYKVSGSFNNNVYGAGAGWYVRPDLHIDCGIWITSDRNHTANHSLLAALGANYLVSKRTAFYVQIGSVTNHGAMNTGLSVDGAFFSPQGTTVGATIGMRHSF
ncbi:porin [Paraburkholderia sp. RL18-085-BIA-A]|uniref:porin n=1 Tax=Paraburkholderia sp. RL18-085-BIA-A TaxID=3031633 RepID=UPI0038B76F11